MYVSVNATDWGYRPDNGNIFGKQFIYWRS